MRRASVDAGHSRRRVGLLQAASSGPNVSLLIVAIEEVFLTSTSAFGKVLEVAKPGWREGKMEEKVPGEGPGLRSRGPRQVVGLPTAPAVDDARFDSGVILPDAAEVGV